MALGWRSSYLRYREVFLNILAIYKRRQDIKTFLEIILSASSVSFFAVFAIKPTLLTVVSLITEIRAKDALVLSMNQKINDLAKAQNIFRGENRVSLVEASVPSDPSVEFFVGQLEGLASAHSVKILGISVGEITLFGNQTEHVPDTRLTALPNDAQALSFSISITGDYTSLQGFISDMEKFRRPVQFDNVGFNTSKEESNKILILVITGRAPYLKP